MQGLNKLGDRVHRNARRKNRHYSERDGVQPPRFLIEAQPQILGYGERARTIIKRHHEDANEHHRGDGADPIEVRSGDAVLRAGSAHADDFLRAEVRGNKCQPADPGGNGAAC